MTANSTEVAHQAQQPQPPQQSSVRGFTSGEAFLQAMIADLADWLAYLHDCDLPGDQEGFLAGLDSGALLCRHAAVVQSAAAEHLKAASGSNSSATLLRPLRSGAPPLRLPRAAPPVRPRAPPGSFMARDSIACFIAWCRALGLHNCILFETEDLVGRKNPRSVVLCLLELARAGARFGLEVPELVHYEQEIDAELLKGESCCSDSGLASPESLQSVPEQAEEPRSPESAIDEAPSSSSPADDGLSAETTTVAVEPQKRRHLRWQCDLRSLDELVRELVSECGCEETFPMKRLDEGKYLFGDSQMLIFVRVLRNHVMVRVGGGWDSLEHLLLKHDPCRRDAATSSESSAAGSGCLRSGVPVGHREERERRRRLLMQLPAEGGVTATCDDASAAAATVATDRPDGRGVARQQRRKMSAPTLSMTELAAATAAAAAAQPDRQRKLTTATSRGGVERQGFADIRELRRTQPTPSQMPTSSSMLPSKTVTKAQSPGPSAGRGGGRRASLQPTTAASYSGLSRIPVPVNPTAPRPPQLLASKRQRELLGQQALHASTGSLD